MHDLVGAAEIADMFGVSRQRVYQLSTREDFPEPVAVLSRGRVWERADVRFWMETHRPTDTDEP